MGYPASVEYWHRDIISSVAVLAMNNSHNGKLNRDAMEWMHTHHISSKPLTIGEKLAMTEMLKEAIREENEKKKLEGTYNSHESRKVGCLQLEASKRERILNTDNQIAKKAGVGVGTVARYNKIMYSDDEELKEQPMRHFWHNDNVVAFISPNSAPWRHWGKWRK